MGNIVDSSKLDFEQVKDSLKTFLRNQSQFADYDFNGSGFSVLLDILAYNSVYTAWYLNMVASEMFLDSAVLRDSVVSRAKMLGYGVRSKRSATATINLTILPDNTAASILIPKGTRFETEIDDVTYTFSNQEAQVVYPDAGDYIVENLELVEGERLTHTFTVDADWTDQRFILPNAGVDTSLLTVKVQNSVSDSTYYVYTLANDFNEITATSRVYFIQEAEEGKTEIYFGDGVVGNALVDGNLVIVEYVVSSGTLANGAATFSLIDGISGYNDVEISVVSSAAGGTEAESIESVKYLAPLNYVTQNRAVTKTDYENLILRDFPNVDSVRVWGGEDNDPPIYGKVYVCIKPTTGTVLSLTTKQSLVDTILKKRNMVSVDVDVVDPDYIYLVINSLVKYKSTLTNLTAAELISACTDTIIEYGEDNLEKFETYFRYSRFINLIDETDDSIQNNLTSVKLMYKLFPSLTIPSQYTIQFNNEIDSAFDETGMPTLSSTAFTYNGQQCYFDDDGDGNVRIYRMVNGSRNVMVSNAGTINYGTGVVQINTFLPTAIASGDEFIEFIVRPVENDVKSYQNQLLVISRANVRVELEDEDTV